MKILKSLIATFVITLLLASTGVTANTQSFANWYLNAKQVERSSTANKTTGNVQKLYTINATNGSSSSFIKTQARVYGKNVLGNATYTAYVTNSKKGGSVNLPCSTVDGSGCNTGLNALMLRTRYSYSTVSHYWGTWYYN